LNKPDTVKRYFCICFYHSIHIISTKVARC
jgi:hypothetical protein